ncbi:hypothetical protein FHX57_002293 [Paraburkholderia tropica]|uniref:Uncharacterized protein DUF4102 n=1 Tax=Paraburkholderia tropica TaxID=92647 RepID=A0ABX5MK20_9BURK|nr:Arm DNA-binding domain-containing protein [Paraburkholderia tropica]MBB2999951.1 hypothetical protein [Paraburkholderia tropica]MBB6319581.1 hypothetical protein [Paraburkholderia tropica]MDE1142926.1 Arm DNA-binding domain-containing protein [Paraburkholderia tropica]PXX13632.1 uncharacterized protein DUF4102 [Paraburkholderia tropica]PZW78563.1 uncharacterized protein DUF4102 [Paraburkholderia tropica]
MALTDRQAKGLQPGDKPVFDGKVMGLMLTPGKTGSKWTLRFTSPVTGKRRDAGLGVYPEVSMLDARNKALAMRNELDAGKDPIEERDREQQIASVAGSALTFEKAARKVYGDLKPGWRNEKHAAQWISTLETYVFPKDRQQATRRGHARRLCGRIAAYLVRESRDSQPYPPAYVRRYAMGLGARPCLVEPC